MASKLNIVAAFAQLEPLLSPAPVGEMYKVDMIVPPRFKGNEPENQFPPINCPHSSAHWTRAVKDCWKRSDNLDLTFNFVLGERSKPVRLGISREKPQMHGYW